MPEAVETSRLNILHVLTLNGRNGEYGGPIRVAREVCTELNSKRVTTHIFSGALRGSEPNPKHGLSESFVLVKPILKKLPVSTLWSWKLIGPLAKEVRKSDLVHIHFARDLISFLAATIAILNRTPFVTQTHGMIVSDGRASTRLIDFLFTRKLINKSQINLVLTEYELNSLLQLRINSPCKILPNGIAVTTRVNFKKEGIKKVVFCSRLEKRKGLDKFIALADSSRHSGLRFEIYGPDLGELKLVEREIKSRNLEEILEYKGSLPAEKVQDMLVQADILVLPSKDEPFPMIVLESLAVGTPVLIMPSCGFSSQLKNFESSFVASTEDLNGLVESFRLQQAHQFVKKDPIEIINFCEKEFSIDFVLTQLLEEYSRAYSHE